MVPLTVSYVNKEQYGIWLTISSIVAWFNFFDAGLGNGLRNRLAESMAKDDLENARIYVSTTYFILGAIFLSIIGVFLIINPFLNWAAILNVDSLTRSYLGQVVLITFCFFSLNLILKLIHTIFLAKPTACLCSNHEFSDQYNFSYRCLHLNCDYGWVPNESGINT